MAESQLTLKPQIKTMKNREHYKGNSKNALWKHDLNAEACV